MTTMLIVDDHPVVRNGFRRIVEAEDVGLFYEADDARSGYKLFYKHRPGIAVIDLSIEDRDFSGLTLIQRMRTLDPEVRILVFSMHDDPVVVARALESGATGYLTKDAGARNVLDAFVTIRDGRSYLDPRLATKVAMLNLSGESPPHGQLNARELQILSLLCKGKSYQAIADRLAVSYRTVIGTCSTMRRKLGARSLADLVRIGMSRFASDLAE